jgi:hypothetical protein
MTTANLIVEAEFTLLKRHMPGATVRDARRYRCDLATLCRLIANPQEAGDTAWVHDVSSTGIGLIYARELFAASSLTLRLRKNDQGGVILIGATVVHATPEVNGAWRIGCRLERELTEEELDSCL